MAVTSEVSSHCRQGDLKGGVCHGSERRVQGNDADCIKSVHMSLRTFEYALAILLVTT